MIKLFLSSTQFLQPNAASRKSCQRCCKQNLIITLAEGVSFKLVSLQQARVVEQANFPSQKFSHSKYSMASRRSSQKSSGTKSGATNPQAPAPAHIDRFSQLEKQKLKIRNGTIRNGTIRDELDEFRRLRYEIETTNTRFDEPAHTGEALDDLQAKVYRHEEEMVGLRRQRFI